MPENIDREEIKVQKAVDLLNKNPRMKKSVAARTTRCSYHRLLNRLHGLLPSSSRGGHNKKLALVEDTAIRDHLILLYNLGRNAGVNNVIGAGNSILRCRAGSQDHETVSRR